MVSGGSRRSPHYLQIDEFNQMSRPGIISFARILDNFLHYLNLIFKLLDDGKCPAFLISCGIIDLDVFCVELWSFFSQQKNFGPNVIYFVLRVDSWVSLPLGKNP